MRSCTRVIVTGAGCAGSAAIKALARDARGRIQLTAVDKQTGLYNYPILPRLLLKSVSRSNIEIPFERLFAGCHATFRHERVRAIDAAGRIVHTEGAELAYDYLIMGLGSRAIPLAQDSGVCVYYPKSSRHLCRLRSTVTAVAERLGRPRVADPHRVYRFAVVGGGLTGVEFAGALREACDRASARAGIRRERLEVSIYERSPALDGVSDAHRHSATLRRELVDFGVRVLTDCHVTRVASDHLSTSRGSYAVDTVVCCAGSKPNLRLDLCGMTVQAEGVIVDQFLRHPNHPSIYAVGDGMSYRDATGRTRRDLRKAHRAMTQGKHAARSIMRCLRGRDPLPYRPRPMPVLVMINTQRGVLSYGGLTVSGRLAGLLKRWLEIRHAAV